MKGSGRRRLCIVWHVEARWRREIKSRFSLIRFRMSRGRSRRFML